ncbi:MAG: mannosyltransferase family protein [Chthoniobacterales bacterium]
MNPSVTPESERQPGCLPQWFIRGVFVPFALTRLLLVLVAWSGFQLAPSPAKSGKWEVGDRGLIAPIEGGHFSRSHRFVDMWSRWDSEWYLSIAQHGYSFTPGRNSNIAFFPLYPCAVRAAHFFAPGQSDARWLWSGIVLSNLSLLVGLTYLHRLIRLDHEEATAARAVLYLCLFPTTLFLSAFYSESLFLALAVSAFYYGRQGRWIVAGSLAGLATLARPPGGLVAVALIFEYLAQKQFRWRELKADCLALALSPLALFAHLAFLRWQFGDWFVLAHAEAVASWSRKFTLPWMTLGAFFQHPHTGPNARDSYLDLLVTLILLGLTTYSVFRLRRSYAIYAVITLLFLLSWGYLTSMPRFAVVIFPVMIALALFGRNVVFHRTYVFLSGSIALGCMVAFSHWVWLG